MFRAALLTTALIAPAQLFAQASTERAGEIAASLQRFLPPGSPGLSVIPQGSGYQLSVDLSAIAKAAGDASVSMTADPLVMQLTEGGDGTFQVSYDQPFTAKLTLPGDIGLTIAAQRVQGSGQFDPALGAFTQHQMSYTALSYAQTAPDGSELGSVTYLLDTMEGQSRSSARASGGIDTVFTYTGRGLKEDMVLPAPDGGAPWNISLVAGEMSGEMTAEGTRSLALLDLVSFVIQHGGQGPLSDENEALLMTQLRAAGPLFDKIEMDGSLRNLEMTTPVGVFTADEAEVDIGLAGAVAKGYLKEDIRLKGLTIPDGLLPPWSAPLLPQDLDLEIALSDYDLATPLSLLLSEVDTETGPTPEQQEAMLAALLPTGKLRLGLGLEADASATYELDIDSDFAVAPDMPMPVGKARISLKGIDAILTALNAAPDEIRQGAIPAIGMARGLGKVDGDETVWDIEMTETGGLFVNGTDMSMFMQ